MNKKLIFLLVIIGLLIAFFVFGGQTKNSPSEDGISKNEKYEYEGVSFDYSYIAENAHQKLVKRDLSITQMPSWTIPPEHIKFYFNEDEHPKYVDPHLAQLLIFSRNEYDEILSESELYSTAISDLSQLLSSKLIGFDDEIPLLPVFNAGQVLKAKIEYLDFDGGKGIRFITYYAQEVNNITNDGVFYTFQGLSDDGEKYISFFHPIHIEILPDEFLDYRTFDPDEYEEYLMRTTKGINDSKVDEFDPAIESLDNFIKSLKID